VPRPWPTVLLAALLLGATFPGCSSSGELPPDMAQLSVASIRGAGVIPENGSFAWHPGSRVLIGDESLDADRIRLLVEQVLREALVERGFRPAASAASCDLLVGYVVAIEESDHASVSEAFGMDPGLLPAASGQTYDRGTIVVQLTRPGSPAPLWRGTAQAHADVTMDEDLRRQRIERAVDRMLGDLNW
jgi:hypothetical protein